MHRSISNPALLRSIIAGVVVLAGSSACSRPDRADDGDNTNQPAATATAVDTQATATAASDTNTAARPSETAAPPRETSGTDQDVSGYQPMARDTLQTDTVAVGDSAQIGKPGERLEGTRASEQANEDTLTNQSDSARIRPPEDTSETSGAAVGSAEMARDTSVAVAQGDTTVQTDTAMQAGAPDTTATATAEAQAADTSAIQVSLDTTTTDQQAEVTVENQPGMEPVADTAVVVGDSAEAGKSGERLEEDSTEVLGTVTPEEGNAEITEIETQDAAVVAAAAVESTGNAVTGANAVAQMTRQGQDCSVVSGPEDVRWDMALSPATLNPCGTGTMTMPKVVTGEE